jgi:methylmalonyl-CoA mutase cobalamin-binding subunit
VVSIKKIIQNTTIGYAVEKCEKEGRMQNFLVAGGLIIKNLH